MASEHEHISPRFYVLRNDFEGPYDTAFEKPDDSRSAGAPTCPRCGRYIGMRDWLPPYRVELEVHGEKGAGDFAMGTGFGLLLSERMAELFRKKGLRGFSGFHPVEVVKMNARAKRMGVPRYFSVTADYGRAAVDEAHSRLRRAEPLECPECRNPGMDGVYGFAIEPGTWDGLDVFRPRGLQGDLVVSERFAELVAEGGLTNVLLTPTERFTWDPLRKGPPADRARA